MFYSSARTIRRTSVRPVAAMTALATAGLALTATPSLATQNADGTVTVDVLGITDFHGRIEADNKIGGAAVLAGAVNQARQANPDTVFVSSGDNVGASTFTSASQQDKPTLDVLNAMALDVSALGNHEFDRGAADLARINNASTFPYVAANITGFEAYGITDVDASHVVTTDSGVRVGFIGVTTPALTSLVSPSGISSLQVTDMAEAANAEAAKLTDGEEANGEADIVVVLAHDGVSTTGEGALTDGSDFAKLVAGVSAGGDVDAVMGGHTHAAYIGESGDVRVTQAGQYSEMFTKISFEYNPATGAVTSQAENVSLAWQNWDRTTRTGDPAFPPVAEIQTIVDAAVAQANVQGAQKIGEITADITRARQTDGKTENRGGESTLGNLIADLQLAAVADLDVDIALINPGGIRADLLYGDDGTVTYKDAALVQPFANSLKTFTLTGEQLVAALEQQWQPEGSSRPFLKLGVSSNLTYVYERDAFAEDRILEVWLDGEPITADQQIKVVANSFLADGGDNFTVLAEGTGHADAGRIDLDVMVDAFRSATAAGSKIAPSAEQRAVGLSLSDMIAGQRASVAVSSMAFTAQPELAGDEVTMTLGADENKVVLTEPMDKELNWDGYDELGFAAFYFSVPEEYADTEQPLTITDGVTTVELMVAVDASTLPVLQIAGGWESFGADAQDRFVALGGEIGEVGAVRQRNLFLTTFANDEGADAPAWSFGRATDDAFMGDWDGDGVSTPAVRRGNTFYVTNSLSGGPADYVFTFGRAGDQVVVGDWDGDGTETFGLRRGNMNYLSNNHTGGIADEQFSFGRVGDEAFVGDFNGDGKDTVSVRRGNVMFVRNAFLGGPADATFSFGRVGDELFTADWFGQGFDTIGLLRGDKLFTLTDNSDEAEVLELALEFQDMGW